MNGFLNSLKTHKTMPNYYYTEHEIDFAYLAGVLNVSGIDGLHNEIQRLKSIGKHPHDIFPSRVSADIMPCVPTAGEIAEQIKIALEKQRQHAVESEMTGTEKTFYGVPDHLHAWLLKYMTHAT